MTGYPSPEQRARWADTQPGTPPTGPAGASSANAEPAEPPASEEPTP